MEIIYYIIFIITLFFYILYYNKLNSKMVKIINECDAKKFDIFASLHTLLFMIYTIIIIVYNVVFLFVFMNKYGGDWRYIAPTGIVCVILLVVVTITGFKQKKIMLNRYRDKYNIELHFYDQVRYISLFRHTCVIINTILIINIISMIIK